MFKRHATRFVLVMSPRIGVLLLSTGILWVLSCASDRQINQEEAIAIAQAHLMAEGVKQEQIEIQNVNETDGNWWVALRFLPYTVGSHCVIVVSPHGRIVRIYPGA